MRKVLLFLCGFSVGIAGSAWAASPAPQAAATNAAQSAPRSVAGFTPAELKEFTALHPIDAHTHVYRHDPAFTAMLQRLHLHIVDIVVPDPADTASHRTLGQLRQQAWQAMAFIGGRGSLSTAFDPFDWSSPGFPGSAVQSLNQDFARGAVGATLWSNPGMTIRDASGHPVLPDNAKLEPVYQDIAAHHKTLFAHLTAVDEAWGTNAGGANGKSAASAGSGPAPGPVNDLPVPPLLRARDRVVQMNPNLRVIGVHLASVNEGLRQIGRRLDQYPNLALDTSLRVDSLMAMPREQVRAFLLKYQDRILYGTDNAFRAGDTAKAVDAAWENRYAIDWRYFSSGDTFQYQGRKVQGLHLPPPVLRKLYHDNAAHWIPGLAQ